VLRASRPKTYRRPTVFSEAWTDEAVVCFVCVN